MTPDKVAERDGRRPWRLSPHQFLVLGFALVILVGGSLLTLPIATVDGQGLGFLDGLFTATSATCVTGLVVVDTGTTFTTFGQLVILSMIQIGGLGIMSSAALFFLLMGKKINFRERMLMQESLNHLSMEGIVRLIRYLLIFTFFFEFVGGLILGIRWSLDFGWQKGMYYGFFHAISSFCNAGFDLFGDFRSLTGYVEDPVVNIVVPLLVIIGGIGFTVILDLYNYPVNKRLSLHTKLALLTTVVVLAGSALIFFVLEYTNPKTLGTLSQPGKFLAAWFQAVTPRTAGYNTLDLTSLTPAASFLTVMLMFIGAAPGSTGGGIKVTTFSALALAGWAMFRGREDVTFMERRIPQEMIYKSLTLTISASALVFFVTMLLTITESADFLALLFEATSAFGTVGLSLGVTPSLSDFGRVIILLTMFAGRLGPLTLALAIAQRRQRTLIRYPEEKIIVG